MMIYVTLHETSTTIDAKRHLYKKLTKQAFIRGLKEPLGSRIRCMRPDSIEKALEYVQEELNTIYLQQRNDASSKSNHSSNYNSNLPKPIYNTNNSSNIFTTGTYTFPPQFKPNPPYQFRMPILNPQYPPRMPTRTQQMFRALPPNYNPRSNVFRTPPRPQQKPVNNGPQPMGGVSHYVSKTFPPKPIFTGHDWSRHGNPPPSNYFKFKDVNFNEVQDQYDYEYYSYNDYYYDPYYQEHYYSEPVYNMTEYQDGNEYSPPSVEETQESSTSNQDFQTSHKSDKQK
ncbi:unnamed protein product [Pieris macdunnoughi]|uniref:Uncharacterized protein n=1 Tax=Pieris macdunnoughi TaxID=345717 RepID=A0A821UHL7_9NEOP|nr:unnamed protein product [Pieris macdunnoughi]